MQSPLETIKDWYLSLDFLYQQDIAALAGHFVFEPNTMGRGLELITNFAQQLDSDGMEPKEIVKKTFFIIQLLNFTFSGRETEEDWAEALDKLLYMKNEFAKQGDPGAVDIMLDNFKERKEGWMKVAAG